MSALTLSFALQQQLTPRLLPLRAPVALSISVFSQTLPDSTPLPSTADAALAIPSPSSDAPCLRQPRALSGYRRKLPAGPGADLLS